MTEISQPLVPTLHLRLNRHGGCRLEQLWMSPIASVGEWRPLDNVDVPYEHGRAVSPSIEEMAHGPVHMLDREEIEDMMRVPEVEIERPFRDPEQRKSAMFLLHMMLNWSHCRDLSTVSFASLLYCNVKNGVIVWKFGFTCDEAARAFDKEYETRTPEEQQRSRSW